MDNDSFDNTPASRILVGKLTALSDAKIQRKVSNRIHWFCRLMCYIDKIESRQDRVFLVNLLKEEFVRKFNALDIPDDIRTYSINVVKTKARKALNGEEDDY